MIEMMKILALTLHLLARITLNLIRSSAVIANFQIVSFQGFFRVCRDSSPNFCEISDIAPQICETPNIRCFAKIANGSIQSTIFAKSSILDVSLGSEYVSVYLGDFFVININGGFYFESFRIFSNLISILLMYLEQKFSCRVQKSYV